MAKTHATQLVRWTELYGEVEAKRRLQRLRAKQREWSKTFYEKNQERVVSWVRRYQEERNPGIQKKCDDRKAGRKEKRADHPKPLFCEACGNPPTAKMGLCFDHCHANGHFRGWLCNPCNLALGLVKDDPERLLRLAAYLEFDRIKRASK